MKRINIIFILTLLCISNACSQKENSPPIKDSNQELFKLEKVVDGIDIPWGLSFTSNNTFLVTDQKGMIYHVVDGKKIVVTGTPEIILTRQGGLLDVAVDEKFEENKRIFITASTSSSESGSNTAL